VLTFHGALLLLIALAGTLVWVAFIVFASRLLFRRAMEQREKDLKFKMEAAPRSDSHMESLLAGAPRSETLLRQYATNPAERGDWPEALRRADLFIARLPRSPAAWLARTTALQGAGREEEAAVALRKAVRFGPKDPATLFAWSRDAMKRKEWNEALRRYDRMRQYASHWHDSYTGAADALMELGRREEAEALVADGMRRHPQTWMMWHAAARIADRAGDLDEAIRRWEDMRTRFPTVSAGYHRGAVALERAGRVEEAAALIRQGRDFFPTDKDIAKAAARLAPATEPKPPETQRT
jgi:tetratricopeptide (TPR) repeat protein